MFDAAAVATAADAAHAKPDAAALALIPDVIAPAQVREADTSLNHGKKEVAFIDTSIAGYKVLEADIPAGLAIVEIDGSQNGLAQMAKWAQTHSGYDAIHIFSHANEGVLELGSAFLTDQAMSGAGVQAELGMIGHALNAGGDLLVYGCDLASGTNGDQFIHDLSAATGADVAASSDATGAASKGGNWMLEKQTGQIDTRTLSLDGFTNTLGNVTTGNDPGAAYSNTNSNTTLDLAQSFTATKTGLLSSIVIYGSTSSNSTLTIYSGDGTNGIVLDTETVAAFNAAGTADVGNQRYIGSTIMLASPVSITNGNVYTYRLTNASGVSFTYTTATDYAGGTLYDTGVDQGSSFDLEFSVTQADAPPAVTDARISVISAGTGTGGTYKIGDTITATWDNTVSGDNNSGITGVTMDFSQFGGGSAVTATNSSGTWTASYTITAGSIDATNRNVSVTANNGASTTTADTTNLSVDNQAPTVTDARISISGASGTGGAYKIGDTVTATWNNTGTGDNNADVSGVTVDFSQFGGSSAIAATNSSGTWTATYTITSGAIDGSGKNVSVTATDDAGNTKTTSDTTSAVVDNIAPTVTDAKISISGASGTGGTFKTGDTVTATWDNTAAGDSNSDTISGVTVDFSQFGGGSAVAATNASGVWTATYTIVAGSINGTTNRNVSVTATDNAGNAKTTADTTNATVDNAAPSITFSGIGFSSDTGSSSSDFMTATAAQTITATLSGAPAGSDIVYGSIDGGATWIDITSKVSGTTLTWDGVTLTSSSTLKLKLTDVAGNDGAIKSQAYTLDTIAPTAPSTPDMTAGTDTGTSNTDNITSNTTPTFTGTAESGSTMTLYDTDGTTVLGTATSTGGNWSITSSALSTGSHTVTAKATDAAGNVSSASSGLTVTVDTAAPTGLGLSATTIASNAATSTTTIATLSATDSQAISYSLAVGNGTNDADNGSFTISGTSLKVGGTSLTAGTYNIYVAATDAAGNVANQAFTITIVDAPSVSSIVRTGGASSTVSTSATSIQYTVTFSESVTGVDVTDFALTATGTAAGNIAGVSGSGTTYTVTVDTISGDGTLRLDLNSSGTGIKNGGNVDIAGGYTAGSTYTLDHTAPGAPTKPDMTIGTDTGTSNADNITSNTTPTFTGTAESGSTVTLYDTDGITLLGTATATGGNWSITSSALSEGSHTITAKATDAAGNVSTASSAMTATIDTTGPVVASVSVPSNASYKAGDTLSFTVNTSEAVTVDTAGGTPRMAMTIGGTTVYATYASGSGSSALVFTYTVQPGDTDTDGITVGTLQSSGGTLKDTAGNSMNVTLNSVGSTSSVLVDTTAPVVNSVSVPADGTYYANQNLDFTVNFSEAVTVDTSVGTPRIALAVGFTTVYADYLSGSGTNALVFRYAVGSGLVDNNGITVGGLNANGGTIRDAASNDATLTMNSVGSTALVNVDGSQPHVTDVTSTTANGAYKAGNTVAVTVTFSAAVTVDTTGGTPSIALGSGGTATYASGSGSTALVFTYTVGAGENTADLDYSATGSLSLNGGTIKDSGGAHQDAILTLATPGAAGSLGANKNIVIDTTPPAITFSNLALSNDSGTSNTDFVTNIASQTITATLSGAPAGTDKVVGSLDGGATWTDITGKVAGTTLTWDGVTLSGSGTLQLKVTDAAGNDGTVKSQGYTYSTGSSISLSNLALSDDTGASKTDFITRTGAQVVSATLSGAPEILQGSIDGGATWTNIGGSLSGTALHWNVTLSGSGTLMFKASDSAGNASIIGSQPYTIDATAPTATVASASFSADTGISSTDFITKTAAQNISGTLGANLANGETVYVSLDDGNTWTAASTSGTSWSLAGQTLSASGTLKVKVADLAGNEGPAFSQAYVFDTVAPQIAVSDLALSSDTGISNTDFITKTAAQTVTATLGTAPVATDRIYGSTDGGTTWTDITGNVSGTALSWNVALAGSNTLMVKAVDAAGNEAVIASQPYVIDTVAPAAAVTSVSFSADTGISSTDLITRTAAQTISGTLSGSLGSGDKVYVSLDSGSTWSEASVSGNSWSISAQLASSNTLKAKVMDAAGNEGPVLSQAYVLDTVAPVAPSVDSQTTTITTPVLTGSAALGAGDALTVSVGGATYRVVASGGSWSLDLGTATPESGSISLAVGNSYGVTVTVTDAAGNTSAASGSLIIAVPPVPPVSTPPLPIVTTPSTPGSTTTSGTTSGTVANSSPNTTAPGGTTMPSSGNSGTPASTGGPAMQPSTAFLSPSLESTIRTSTVAGSTSFATPSGFGSASFGNTGTLSTTGPGDTTLGLGSRSSLTQGGGSSFQVVVASSSGLGGEGLVLNRGISDQVVSSTGRAEISVPSDAFAHTNPNASVHLSAQQANGQPLPNWVAFDGRSGKFIVNPPPGVRGELSIKLVARDSEGHEVASVFKIRVGARQGQEQGQGQGQQQQQRPAPGRASLSEQLHLAANHKNADGVLDRLARLAKAASWSES